MTPELELSETPSEDNTFLEDREDTEPEEEETPPSEFTEEQLLLTRD